MNFQSLPAEIRLQIFSYLNNEELSYKASPVCKQWQQLATDPTLWKIIDIDGDKFRCEEIVDILKKCFLVEDVTFFRIVDWSWIVDMSTNYFLQSISLVGCYVDVDVIESLVSRFPLVKNFTAICCRNVDENVVRRLVKWRLLESVTIQNCNNENVDKNGDCLSIVAEFCFNLQSLVVENTFDVYDSEFLSITTQRGSKLRKLVLDCSLLTDISYKSLEFCRNLVELRLNCVEKMSDNGLMAIKDLKNLEILHLSSGNAVSTFGFANLFVNNCYNNMRSLSFSHCYNIDNNALMYMALSCPNLTNFTLSNSGYVTSYGLYELVKSCRNLIKISLTGLEKITGVSLIYSSNTLTTVEINDCIQISIDFLQIASITKPYLEILVNGTPFNP